MRGSAARLPAGPLLCYVTDRRRLAAARGEPADAAPVIEAVAACARAAARSGVSLIQVREPDLPAARLHDLVTALLPDVRAGGARLVVNERLDVALAAAADGVHLRESSIEASAARRIAPGMIVGRSVHSVPAAGRQGSDPDLDYLVFGTVFATASKPGPGPRAGVEGLRSAVAAARLPVIAIGGVRVEHLAALAATGCAGAAAVGLFQDAAGAAELREIVSAFRRAFDTAGRVP